MNRRDNTDFEELEELLWRAEKVLEDTSELPSEEDFSEYGLPEDEIDEPAIYNNYANSYGSDPQPAVQRVIPRKVQPAVRQQRVYQDPAVPDDDDGYGVPPKRTAAPKNLQKSRRHRRGCGCGCLTWLLVLMAAIAVAFFLFVQPPKADSAIGDRKRDSATVLICGTDKDGTRTDTMMLLYLSGSDRQVSLLSLPRDSYTVTSSGNAAKLNSAFGRGGTGEEGMENLMDYVQDIVGYRPDGYVLVDFTLVPQIVDIMGGVEVEVPMDMKVDGVSLKAGLQKLDGKQALTLLRFRKGYAMADLTRVEVQRSVLKACMEQWVSPAHIADAMEAISLVESGSISSLTTGNYIWIAKTLLTGMGNFRNDTLPGYPDYRGGVSYYILDRSDIAELVNESYNPYNTVIDPDDLNIAG